MRLLRRALVCTGCVVGLLPGGLRAAAQTTFSTVVVFGDSLSDTGNIAHLTQSATLGLIRYPSDNTLLGFDYTDGRFTDGKDTQPAAQAYFGVWIEQLAASFPGKPAVTDSLDGGTNFAFGDATTGAGTTTVSEGPISITLDNMGKQVTDYLSRSPAPVPNAQTLYVLWGGANDIYSAAAAAVSKGQDPVAAANTAATTAAQNEIGLVTQLANLGATNFMVPNLPPLGAVPDDAGTVASPVLTAAAALFQTTLAQGLATLKTGFAAKGTTLNIYQPDIFTLFNTLTANPMAMGLGDVKSKAQNVSGSPDTYLFWDGEHPTTTGHHFAAAAAANLLTPLVASSTALTVPAAVLAGQSATLSAKVTASSSGGATPTGLVTFFNGSTVVGSTALDGTGTGTVTFTGMTAASPYSITAVYAGDTTYNVSASTAKALAVLASAVGTSTALNVGLNSTGTGQTATLTATVTPAVSSYGSPAGTVTFYDGTTKLGTGTLSSGTATLTTAVLSVGSHSFTASYGAAGIFAGSTSAAVGETVAGLGFTATADPSSLTIKDGGMGTTTLKAVDTGGFTGSITPSCGSPLPTHLTCSIAVDTLPLPAGVSEWTLTIGTTGSAESVMPARPGVWRAPRVFSAVLLFPGMAGMLLFGVRRRLRFGGSFGLIAVVVVLGAGAMLGLAGCGNSPDVAKGTYTVPVIFTPAAGSGVAAETVNLTVTVN